MVNTVRGQAMNFIPCNPKPADYVGPPIPALPDQFETHVEANIVQKNMTRNFKEYYDFPNNRGMIETYNRTSGERMRILTDFNTRESKTIFENNTCRFLQTNSSHPLFVFMSADNGTHIKSVKDLLHFGSDLGEVFIDGDKIIRGIPVNHWSTCLKMPATNGTMTLDYFFTKALNYTIDGAEMQVPVRAVLNGTGKSYRNGSVSDDSHSFYHIYEFSEFKPGPIKDSHLFEVPVGVICNQGDIDRNKSVPEISNHFSAGVERVILENSKETNHHSLQLYVDISAKVYRVDTDGAMGPMDAQKYGNKPLTYITDSANGIVYVIDRFEKNCSVSKVMTPPPQGQGQGSPPQGQGPPPQGQGPPASKPSSDIVEFFANYSRFLYQEQKSWRGLPVYTWGYVNSTTQEITEVIFRKPQIPGNPMGSGGVIGMPGVGPNMPVNEYEPVGIYKFTPSVGNLPPQTTYEHIYGFSNGHPDPDVFDVSACYAWDQHSTYLAVDVSGNNAGNVVRFYQKEFMSQMRQTLANAAKVSVTRISSIKWEERSSSGSNTVFVVTFLLLDNKLQGLDGAVYSGPPLHDAIQNLQNSVKGDTDLTFGIQLTTGASVRFTIMGGSLWELYSGSETSHTESSIKTYGAGSMAGLAIGMLVIGVLLGLIGAYVIYKRFDASVPYEITK